MFRNLFTPGFAIIILGIFTFSRQPASTQTSAVGGSKKGEAAQSLQNKPKTATALAVSKIGPDKAVWDRDAIDQLALYQLDSKLAEFDLGQASVPPVAPSPVNPKRVPVPNAVADSHTGTGQLEYSKEPVPTAAQYRGWQPMRWTEVDPRRARR